MALSSWILQGGQYLLVNLLRLLGRLVLILDIVRQFVGVLTQRL